MTREDLISKVAIECGTNKNTTSNIIKSTLNCIEQALTDGDKVVLKNFGTFTVETTAAHNGRNPQTGETIQVPEKKRIKFTAGEPLRRVINN